MKKMIAAIIVAASANAFAGYTTVVCQTNEAGVEYNCRKVHFNRDLGVKGAPQEGTCSGEAEDTVCEKHVNGVPTIIKRISGWFQQRGFSASHDNDMYTGG